MARNLFILAGAFGVLAVACGIVGLSTSSTDPQPGAAVLVWREIALFMLLGSILSALVGTLLALYEQVGRRERGPGGELVRRLPRKHHRG